MKIEVDWETFHGRFYMEGMIYVKEHDNFFEFYTCREVMKIHCIKEKSENPEENIIFIERYMTDKKNIIKVLNFEGYEEEEETIEEEEEEFVQPIELKEKEDDITN